MAYANIKNTVVYVTEELTEGTAVDPTLGSQSLPILADGFSIDGEKELVERNLLRSGIKRQLARTGIKSATAALNVEATASSTAGSAPQYDLLMQSLLAGKRQISTQVTTKATGNTASILQIEDADISKFNVGDIILVLEAGAYHVSPIIAVDSTGGAANITLLIAGAGAFSNSVVIEKTTVYYGANSGHKNLTVTAFMEDAYKLQAAGVKVSSMSLESFEVGQLPSLSFSLNGQSYNESTASSGITATNSNALPPIVLNACVYKDGVAIPVRSVALSVDNTLGRITSTCSANGIISQIVTERSVSGSITPYLDTTSTTLFDNFDANTSFSLFLSASNPTATAGEVQNIFSIFIPTCIITALPKNENDGVLGYDLSFQAGEDESGNYTSEIYLGMI